MNADQLSAIAGLLLSLAMAYIPGLKDWFDKLPKPEYKAAIMAGLVVVVALSAFGLGCAKWVVTVPCSVVGIQQIINAIVNALIGMASGYVTLVRPFKK